MLKSIYVSTAHALSPFRLSDKVADHAATARPEGLMRWLASLFAIYDIDQMLRLDIPWWNVKAAVTVERFLEANRGARIFEYGSGASSLWLARRAGSVVSVEHDETWAEKLRPHLSNHQNAAILDRKLEDGSYVNAIAEQGGLFDLIVVDGRRRVDCLHAAIPYLKPAGIIVFDDSGRRRYRSGIETCGLAEHAFIGRSYCVPYPDHTSLLTVA